MTDDERRQLDEIGFLLLQQFMDEMLLHELRTELERLFDLEGDRAGAEFKPEAGCRRLANLVDKGEVFRGTIAHPRLLPFIRHVLGFEIKLSSQNARSVNPHCGITQPLHADMSALPDEKGYWVCNSVWLLDDFTAENGAIRFVPGSHSWGRLPQDALDDPTAPHPDEVVVTGRAGDVLVMNAHCWHGGLPNWTDNPRTAMHVFYCRRDKPQQQHQQQLLRPEVQQALSPELRDLLALDDPDNDRVTEQAAVRSGFLK